MSFQYNIFDGGLAGQVTSQPDIKLSELAMADNSNIIIEDGEVQTCPLRLLEGLDNNGNQIRVPDIAYNIVSVTALSNTIVFNGTGSTIGIGSTIYLMGNDDGSNNYNDGYYTVATVSEGGGNTTIETVENIVYDSVNGWTFWGYAEALKIKRLLTIDGSEELFIFTDNQIFQWKLAGLTLNKLTLPFFLTDVEHWSVEQGLVNFGTTGSPDNQQGLIACHGQGRPFKIEDNGTVTVLEAEIDGVGNYVANAKHCYFFNNILLLGNVVLNNGDELPSTFYNSDLTDTANFQSNDAGFFITEGVGAITAFSIEKDNLIIFKESSIIQAYFTGDANIFQLNRISNIIGCLAPDSVVSDRQHFIYFFGTDKRFKILRGLGDISDVIEKTVDNLKDSLIPKIRSTYDTDENRLIWSVPFGANATQNNKCIVIKQGVWSFLDIGVSAFSDFNKVFTDTWDTVNNQITWDNSVGAWNDVQGQSGNTETLVSDFEGNLSTLFTSYDDKGKVYESYVTISTDLNSKKALNVFKRITKIRFYFVPITSGDTIYLDVSKDNNLSYDNLTSFSAYDIDKDINIITKAVSIRAKSFRLKIRSTDRFNLVGMILYGEVMGDR
jgi:hypothetical protein